MRTTQTKTRFLSRGSVAVTRRAHIPEDAGSNPAPAIFERIRESGSRSKSTWQLTDLGGRVSYRLRPKNLSCSKRQVVGVTAQRAKLVKSQQLFEYNAQF